MSVYKETKSVCMYRDRERERVCVCGERERERERERDGIGPVTVRVWSRIGVRLRVIMHFNFWHFARFFIFWHFVRACFLAFCPDTKILMS